MIEPKIHPQLLLHPLRFYLRKFRRWLFVGFFFLIITNVLDGISPLLIKLALDQLEKRTPLAEVDRTILFFFFAMTGLAVTRWGWRYGFGHFHTSILEHLRRRTFIKLLSLSQRFFHKSSVGDLVSVVINDIQTFRQNIGAGLLVFFDGVIILSVILPIMVRMNADWTWKCLLLVPLVPLAIFKMMRKIHLASQKNQENFGEISRATQENVSGIRLIKGFAIEDQMLKNFATLNERYQQSSTETALWDSMFAPLFHGTVAFGNVILVFLVLQDQGTEAISLGTFVAFSRYIQKMVWPMMALGMGLSQFQKGFGAFERVKDLLQQTSEIKDKGSRSLPEFESLEVKNLNFHYQPTAPWILKNVSFQIQRGEFVGLIGPVGAGKSTLLQLLPRLFDASSGEILINGHAIREYRLEDLRKQICLVPQDLFLFSETIKENVHVDEPDSTVQEILARVQLMEEIEKFPSGLHTSLGERGVNLSGGQRQRMTLARALIKLPQVLLIDDTLSAVDVETEGKILQAIGEFAKGKTLIMVSHRIESLRQAQKIIVLSEGQIEAIGTHDDLLHFSPTYKVLADLQTTSGTESQEVST